MCVCDCIHIEGDIRYIGQNIPVLGYFTCTNLENHQTLHDNTCCLNHPIFF